MKSALFLLSSLFDMVAALPTSPAIVRSNTNDPTPSKKNG